MRLTLGAAAEAVGGLETQTKRSIGVVLAVVLAATGIAGVTMWLRYGIESTSVPASPGPLPAGRSFESTITSLGDASAMFARQPSLTSELTSRMAAQWADTPYDPGGDHLILALDVIGGKHRLGGAELYAVAYEQWWSRHGSELTTGSGSLVPIRIRLAGRLGSQRVVGYDMPGDDPDYEPGFDRLFPKSYALPVSEAVADAADLDAAGRHAAMVWLRQQDR